MRHLSEDRIRWFFKDLGIVVCDDSALIASKMKRRRAYYVMLGSKTDPQKQALAKEWMQLANRAANKLPTLLEAVFDDFRNRAEVSVLASGKLTVDQTLLDGLIRLAQSVCLWNNSKLERPTSSKMYNDWVDRLRMPHPDGIGLPPLGGDGLRAAVGRVTRMVTGSGEEPTSRQMPVRKAVVIATLVATVSCALFGLHVLGRLFSKRGEQRVLAVVSPEALSDVEPPETLSTVNTAIDMAMNTADVARRNAEESHHRAERTADLVAAQKEIAATALLSEPERLKLIDQLTVLYKQALESRTVAEEAIRRALAARNAAESCESLADTDLAAVQVQKAEDEAKASEELARTATSKAEKVQLQTNVLKVEQRKAEEAEKRHQKEQLAFAYKKADAAVAAARVTSSKAQSIKQTADQISRRMLDLVRDAGRAHLDQKHRSLVDEKLTEARDLVSVFKKTADNSVAKASIAEAVASRATRGNGPKMIIAEADSAEDEGRQAIEYADSAERQAADLNAKLDQLEGQIKKWTVEAPKVVKAGPAPPQPTLPPPELTVVASPPGCSIEVDDGAVTSWPVTVKPDQKIVIVASKLGYIEQQISVLLQPGDERKVEFRLQAAPVKKEPRPKEARSKRPPPPRF